MCSGAAADAAEVAADYKQLAEVVNIRLQVKARRGARLPCNTSLHWAWCLEEDDLGTLHKITQKP
jgi:hypothetical protein